MVYRKIKLALELIVLDTKGTEERKEKEGKRKGRKRKKNCFDYIPEENACGGCRWHVKDP